MKPRSEITMNFQSIAANQDSPLTCKITTGKSWEPKHYQGIPNIGQSISIFFFFKLSKYSKRVVNDIVIDMNVLGKVQGNLPNVCRPSAKTRACGNDSHVTDAVIETDLDRLLNARELAWSWFLLNFRHLRQKWSFVAS